MADSKASGDNGDARQGTITGSVPAATEQEQEQARRALQEFDKANYDSCLSLLGKLASSGRSQDPKLMHNKAVVDYFKSKCTRTEEFRKSLHEVIIKSHVNVESLTGLEDVDQCVMCYNLALLHVRAKQPYRALAVLDKLLQFIEPLEETLSRKILFLMVELCLITQQPERAHGLLGYVDKSGLNGGGGKGNSQTGGSASQSPEKEREGGGKEGSQEEGGETWRSRASVYKAVCYLKLKSLKSCKRELKSLVNVSILSTPTVYLKAQFEYMKGNYRKAVKVLGSAPLPTGGQSTEGLPAIFYNNMAVLHFHMHKQHLATFYLRKAMQENEQASKAAQASDAAAATNSITSGMGSGSRHYELLYNLGVSLLHCGQPVPAFDCLVQTVQVYPTNPRLWLRLAECCIMKHRASNDEDRKLDKRLEVIQGSVGSGVHRKLILGSGLQTNKTSSESAVMPVPSLEFASLCLRNAMQLLPEEGATGSGSTGKGASGGDSETGDTPDIRSGSESLTLVPAPPGAPMRPPDVHNLRCSVLASMAYVGLCLNDHLVALQCAQQLLQQSRLSGAHRYLAHMYQAEALVALDRIADAVTHLNPEKITDVSCTFPEQSQPESGLEKNGDKDNQDLAEPKAAGALYPWCPWDVQRARAIMQYNLATAHAIRGEQDKALQQLGKSTQQVGLPLPAQMYFLKLYLELMEGRKKTVHNIIKEHFGHVTPNRM